MIHDRAKTLPRRLKDRLKKAYRSDVCKRLIAFPRRPVIFAKQLRSKPVFSVEVRSTSGLFAILQLVLFIIFHCKEKGLLPDISARGGSYGDIDGRVDWFGRWFERMKPYGPEIEERIRRKDRIWTARVSNVQQLGFRRRYENRLELAEASRLFLEHYRPSSSIRNEVDSLARKLSVHSFTLGVHYRGTDKANEAGRVSWETFVDAVRQTIVEEPLITSILASSDEPEFLDHLRQQEFACTLNVIPSPHLSINGRPVHFSGHDGLQIGREALVTSLLLSRCGFLVKTASYLSAWSKIFNPELKVLLLSPPGIRPIWFPDSALWASQRSETGESQLVPAFHWYWRKLLAD